VTGVICLLFPPFQFTTTSQSVHLGFGFVFSDQAGQINIAFLLVELAATALAYWLIDKFIAHAHETTASDLPHN
jgi:hypothetical protein